MIDHEVLGNSITPSLGESMFGNSSPPTTSTFGAHLDLDSFSQFDGLKSIDVIVMEFGSS